MDGIMESDLVTSIGNLHKLQHLDLQMQRIHPTHLPTLSHLSLYLSFLSDKGLEILGGLPQLSYLCLCIFDGPATLTGAADRVYFQKLRSFMLPWSMVQFVVNEEDSSVSFAVWSWSHDEDAPAFGSKRKQVKCRAARAVMPNLEALYFQVDVAKLTACDNGSCDNLGLEYLAFLQKVTVRCNSLSDEDGAGAGVVDVVEQQKAALRHAIQVHRNRPTLQLANWEWRRALLH
ncbi:hypothetical protein U9M48_001226 [Paspalum notatum var. saurae]|uniref:Disease resistance R13L4/SHOC-2-like LRR domain-containing protein n=1 Tax=Paspalum notatum var. saurae TaxID=547442 RepID=A0AAQ3SGI3_PASNO